MKNKIFTIILLFVSISTFAQLDKEKSYTKKISEKLKALKVAHITEQLDLTKKEAEAFWPIYNAHEEEKHKHFESSMKKRKDLDIEKLTESEAEALLKEVQANEEAKVKSEKAFIEKLSKVISYKKIVKLMHAERTFKRKMIEEFRGRHREMRKD